jgi:HAD superfamily 5'-nucleotidase-like hydrolase
MSTPWPASSPRERRVYCNRTLNLRSIHAIGYDMDYTLVHYRVADWERLAYRRLQELLADDGWPVSSLSFEPSLVVRGLVIDTELGNIVKANRFGYVMRAFHGTRPMPHEEQRRVYRHSPVDLSEQRFRFLNTLFSLSASCLYAQLVDLYDQRGFPGVHGYRDLYRRVGERLDEAHIEGTLKARILADPERYIELDPETPLALLDQYHAGKRLMLISNAEWSYAREIMAFTFDRYLPGDTTWRDLFELVIVAARKPDFFDRQLPLFCIVDEQGLLRPVAGRIPSPGSYLGGDASKVEEYLGLSGAQILYVGDHIFADVRMSKSTLRWRTALILRELEKEVSALEDFRSDEVQLSTMMATKERLEDEMCTHRLALQRLEHGYGPSRRGTARQLAGRVARLREQIEQLDASIAPLARTATEVRHPEWGPLLRAGNDKSHLARQVEGSADVYTSRVSNFLHATPFAYLRSRRGSMPHDPDVFPEPGREPIPSEIDD